jgi:peptide chain release factor subunit 3
MQMDDPSISADGKWDEKRYNDIVNKLTPFLKGCGYNPAKDLAFCPLAALTGGNVLNSPDSAVCDWWKGSTLFQLLDSTDAPKRDPMASFRMPVMDRYKDMGTVVMGKSESGVVQVLRCSTTAHLEMKCFQPTSKPLMLTLLHAIAPLSVS